MIIGVPGMLSMGLSIDGSLHTRLLRTQTKPNQTMPTKIKHHKQPLLFYSCQYYPPGGHDARVTKGGTFKGPKNIFDKPSDTVIDRYINHSTATYLCCSVPYNAPHVRDVTCCCLYANKRVSFINQSISHSPLCFSSFNLN